MSAVGTGAYAAVGSGLCDDGLGSLGILVYNGGQNGGLGDNEGTTQERTARCASACFSKGTPLAYGPWSSRGDALGFGVAESNGRCYCQHQAYASCAKQHQSLYTTYEFIGTATHCECLITPVLCFEDIV